MIDIKVELEKRYEELQTFFDIDNIVGIFVKGSYNYNLQDDLSDFDTVAILLENNLGISCISSKNGRGEFYLYSLKQYFLALFQLELTILDSSLFSKYYILNEKYQQPFLELIKNREDIIYSSPKLFALQAYLNIKQNYQYIRAHCGYEEKKKAVLKWLSHIIRVTNYLKNYEQEKRFTEILDNSFEDSHYVERLKALKRGRVDMNWNEIKDECDKYLLCAQEYVQSIREKWGDKVNLPVREWITSQMDMFTKHKILKEAE